MTNSESKLEQIIAALGQTAKNLLSPEPDKKTKKRNYLEGVGKNRYSSTSSDHYKEITKIREKLKEEQNLRNHLNSYDNIADRGLAIGTAANLLTHSFSKAINGITIYSAIYDLYLMSYCSKTCSKNYIPSQLEDKINKYALPIAAAVSSIAYYFLINNSDVEKFEPSYYVHEGLKVMLTASKMIVDWHRRYNEKIIENKINRR
ncbi:MAG: hypothetical protein Q8O89_06660 [Nanoarchaeota archaeon]|nr:hypothetical protein [Nanoarchaeota archaeon]